MNNKHLHYDYSMKIELCISFLVENLKRYLKVITTELKMNVFFMYFLRHASTCISRRGVQNSTFITMFFQFPFIYIIFMCET